jgi:integrase
MARHLTLVRQPQKLPVVLTMEEIARLIAAPPGPKYKAALVVVSGAGLRRHRLRAWWPINTAAASL